MQNKKQLILVISILVALVGLSYLSYHLYQELRRVKESVELVQDVQVRQRAVLQTPAEVDTSPARKQRWSVLQSKFQNAVMQVFTQSTEFNWLEPYKSPAQQESTGTGFFISNEGYVITNAHVVSQAILVTAQIPSIGKRRFELQVVGISPDRDLALLKMPEKEVEALKKLLEVDELPYLTLGDSDVVRRGDKLMALGFPLGQQGLKSTTGVVSGREHMPLQGYFIQISAPINPGSSGGPSLDAGGRVIGVNTAGILGAQNVGYIVPSNEVLLFLDQLGTVPKEEQPKLLRRPFLGVFFSLAANDDLRAFLNNPEPGGLYVVDTYKGGPFDKAGIKAGDMIYKIDSYPIDMHGELSVPWSAEDHINLADYVARLKLGHKMSLDYYRKGTPMSTTLSLELGDSPIRLMFPGYEKIDYEVLGGFVFMPLTINHAAGLAKAVPQLMQYIDPQKETKPAVIITHVMLNSPASKLRPMGVGGLIAEVNGQEVHTLDELREAALKSSSTGYLTIKTVDNQFGVLALDDILASEERLARTYHYKLSDLYKELSKARS